MLLSPSSKIRSYTGPRTQWAPLLLVGSGWGGRELWLQTRPYSHRAKHLGRHDHLGLVPPLIQLEKGQVNFGASKKSSAGFPASAAATTRSKLSCGNLASIGSNPSRARRTWGIREKSPGVP